MILGDYIKHLRKASGLTQEELGEKVGVKKAAVQKWESGQTTNLKRATINELAKIFDVSPASFFPESSTLHTLPTTQVRMIPLFETVSAGFGAYADSQIIDYTPIYIKSDTEAEETLCIRVEGDSMYPKIEDGDIIQVHKQDSVDSGSIAVVLIDGEEGLVKKVVYGDDWIELHSLNPEYKTKRFEGPEVLRVRVVGLVKSVIKTL